MPKQLTQYRIFIASPGGLTEERNCFRKTLEDFNSLHGEPRNILFHPVGWEDTPGGAGRPQALINEDLKPCDYALFVLHDRWGSPTGNGHRSGVEEEWTLAEALYQANTLRNILFCFKTVDQHQMCDPGPQLAAVLRFKAEIEAGEKYLFKQYETVAQFAKILEAHLAQWQRDCEKLANALATEGFVSNTGTETPRPVTAPNFNYWITEAHELLNAEEPNFEAALFCAEKAVLVAKPDMELEWAQGRNAEGAALLQLGNLDQAILIFNDLLSRLGTTSEVPLCEQVAQALFNKGITLGRLGRSRDEIAVYDDLIAQFGKAPEARLRELVAKALFCKTVTPDPEEDRVAAYNDLMGRFFAEQETRSSH